MSLERDYASLKVNKMDDALQRAFIDDIYAAYIINLAEDTALPLRLPRYIQERLGMKLNVPVSAKLVITTYANTSVAEESRPTMLKLLDPQWVTEQLTKDSSQLFSVLLFTEDGSTHYRTMRISRIGDDPSGAYLLTYSWNSDIEAAANAKIDEVQREREKIENLFLRDYIGVYRINWETDTGVPSRVPKYLTDEFGLEVGKPICYTKVMGAWIEGHVFSDDKEFLKSLTDRDAMNEMLGMDNIVTRRVEVENDGQTSWRNLRIGRIDTNDYITEMVMGFQDVDGLVLKEQEQKKALEVAYAAAERANRAKTTFLNSMSHDIRTPMNAIIGFTGLAATHIDDPSRLREYLSKIQTSSSHLLSLINDVLDMSRIESGKVNIEEKKVHLPDVMHDLRTIVQSDIKSRNLDFYIDTMDVQNEDVYCDKLRLSQILLNIVSNAMKFTKPGGTVSVKIEQVGGAPSGYANYVFKVRDTGIGMSQEFLGRIFSPFEREETATVSGIQGSGLGMAITKNIVDMMGGTISVKSELGVGSEFTVSLQFRMAEEQAEAELIPELEGSAALVVDDDIDCCISVCKMLSKIGMRPEWTSSGREAVIRAQYALERDDAFDVYIVDWLMPDMNGVETVRRIRRIIGDDKPIIILTSYDWEEVEQEAREAGVTHFISKPIFMSELRDILCKPLTSAKSDKAEEDAEVDFTGRRLLLVEDNELNQEIAVEILEQRGFEVEAVADGVDAVARMEHAQPGEFDAVLMDIQMPRMDGYEATRQIRKLEDAQVAAVPIIAMTANAFEEDRNLALQAGMNDHIAKPIDTDQLFKTLQRFL